VPVVIEVKDHPKTLAKRPKLSLGVRPTRTLPFIDGTLPEEETDGLPIDTDGEFDELA
jgi:hypothetical protein